MVKIKGEKEKTKTDMYYTKVCDILEELVEKENSSSLKFYRNMGTIYNDYPDCVSGVIEFEVIKKRLKKPIIDFEVYNKDFFDMAYKAAERIEKELEVEVTLEKVYVE